MIWKYTAAARLSMVDALVLGNKHFHTLEVQKVVAVITSADALEQITASSSGKNTDGED